MRDEEPALGVLCVYGVCADGFCKIEMGSGAIGSMYS